MRTSPLIRQDITLSPEPPAGEPLYDLARYPMCNAIMAFPEKNTKHERSSCGFDNPTEQFGFEDFGKRTEKEIRTEFRDGTLYGVVELPDGALEIVLGEIGQVARAEART